MSLQYAGAARFGSRKLASSAEDNRIAAGAIVNVVADAPVLTAPTPTSCRSASVRDSSKDVQADRVWAMTADNVGADWRLRGVRVVRGDELDGNTPQTPGMNRAAAITAARAGAEKLWAGTVIIDPAAKTGAHHHGSLESVIYVVSGRARMRWGERLEYMAEAGPGDFIYVPAFVPHQEINARPDAPLSCVVVRSGRNQWSSSWTCPRSSPIPNRSTGSTTSTGSPEPSRTTVRHSRRGRVWSPTQGVDYGWRPRKAASMSALLAPSGAACSGPKGALPSSPRTLSPRAGRTLASTLAARSGDRSVG